MASATSTPSTVRSRSRLWHVCQWLILSMVLIVIAGAVYQLSMVEWESHRYPPPGKLVDIGGLRLHINCTGAGSPTVILEAGPNDSSLMWQLAQPQISRFTHVCSYDRAGFGWSDPPNEPRSSLNIANELDRLLTRAAVPGPYVLKALALGARAVLIGRPALWGLAAAGAEGVQHVLEMLHRELDLAMALTGRPALASLDASVCGFREW